MFLVLIIQLLTEEDDLLQTVPETVEDLALDLAVLSHVSTGLQGVEETLAGVFRKEKAAPTYELQSKVLCEKNVLTDDLEIRVSDPTRALILRQVAVTLTVEQMAVSVALTVGPVSHSPVSDGSEVDIVSVQVLDSSLGGETEVFTLDVTEINREVEHLHEFLNQIEDGQSQSNPAHPASEIHTL